VTEHQGRRRPRPGGAADPGGGQAGPERPL